MPAISSLSLEMYCCLAAVVLAILELSLKILLPKKPPKSPTPKTISRKIAKAALRVWTSFRLGLWIFGTLDERVEKLASRSFLSEESGVSIRLNFKCLADYLL